MILVYTGNGKGKTSATVGQAIRALGHGMRVAFGQFMKRDEQAGEQTVLTQLLEKRFRAGGMGFLTTAEDRPLHRKAALELLEWAKAQFTRVDMLLLDEALYALGYGLVTEDELKDLMRLAEEHNVHLVLSGRNAPEWLTEQADLVTEMQEIKHPYASGIPAARGIEF